MKILLAIDTYQTNNNGTSISAQRYAGTLRQHGHQVRVLSVDSDDYRLPERHIYPFNKDRAQKQNRIKYIPLQQTYPHAWFSLCQQFKPPLESHYPRGHRLVRYGALHDAFCLE